MDPKETIINELQKAAADVLATEAALNKAEVILHNGQVELHNEFNEKHKPLRKQSENAYTRFAEYTEALRLIEEEGMDPLMARMTASAGNTKKRVARHDAFDDPFREHKAPYNWNKHQHRMRARRRLDQ